MKPHRREFLEKLAAGTAALSLPRALLGQTSPKGAKLTDKITLITGASNNIVALAGDGGSLLVDCGDAIHATEVSGLAGGVKRVINTHWHLESTGANDAMAKAGAKITSHVNTELWMTQEIIHDWEKKVFPPRAKEALPTDTFYTTAKTTFGGETLEYGLLPMAHTRRRYLCVLPAIERAGDGGCGAAGKAAATGLADGRLDRRDAGGAADAAAYRERFDQDCARERAGDESKPSCRRVSI